MVFCRSYYSFGFGVSSPAALAGSAAAEGFGACILADEGGLYGMLEFADAAVAAGIRPGAGARMRILGRPCVVVALEGGWPGLCSLVTAVRNPGFVPLDEALHAASATAAIVLDPGDAVALSSAGYSGRLYCAVMPAGSAPAGRRPVAPSDAERMATDAGLRPIAFHSVCFTDESGPAVHRILRAGTLHRSLASLPESLLAPAGSMMPGREVFHTSFPGARLALSENAGLAEEICASPPAGASGRRSSPAEDAELRSRVCALLPGVYGSSRAAASRAEAELAAIAGAGLSAYFLAFAGISDFCRDRGITASARGSAGGSLVAFVLGLSPVCPLRYGLSFSRFFNRLRPDPPDIDLDIDSERRDEVNSWILSSRGREAACVGAVVCHRLRSAFRVAAEARGMSPSDIDTMSSLLSDRSDRLWKSGHAGGILAESAPIAGLPSHLAPHPCGLVMPGFPVDTLVPVERGAQGQPLLQFDLEGVERVGLLKMDLLGQRGLSVISRVCKDSATPPWTLLRAASSPSRDALSLLDRGETLGVVHVESPAMRGLLREMRIETLDDVARALALVRPGASAGGGRERYQSAIRGGRVEYPLPQLREVLRDSFGVMLYEEDVSEAARCLFGIDEAESDLLRRRLKKKTMPREEIESLCRRSGMSPRDSAVAWDVLSGYAGYGFCRAHAYAYAAVACVSAGLKHRDPAGFMAAVLAGGGGFYDAATYVEEARRLGLCILPPGVNTGLWLARPVEGGLMLGFSCIRGMGEAEFSMLESGRPFSAPWEVTGAGCGRQVARSMARSGCFDELGINRAQALWGVECAQSALFGGGAWAYPDLPSHGPAEKVKLEVEEMDLAATRSPLSLVGRPDGTIEAGAVSRSAQSSVWGRVATWRRLDGGAGFLMLQDTTGVVDMFLPAKLFQMALVMLRRPGATVVARIAPEPGGRFRAVSVEPGPLTPSRSVV
jgi:DNA polymerase III alpha subunit